MSWKRLELYLEQRYNSAKRFEIAKEEFLKALLQWRKAMDDNPWPTPPPKGGQPLPVPEAA